MIQVKFKKLNENAQIPQVKHIGDGAADLKAVSCTYDAVYDRFVYGFGFATEFDTNWRARICPRGGNTKTEAYVPNTPGLIEGNYRGEWVMAYKLRTPFTELFPGKDPELEILEMENEYAPYKVGDLIGQVYFERNEDVEWIEVDELSDSNRGADGGIHRKNLNFSK